MATQPKRPPPKKQGLSDAQIVVLIAGALATGASVQAMAAVLSPEIGIPKDVLRRALTIATSRPIRYSVTVIASATASAESQSLESHYRALYVLNAARRLESAKDPAAALEAEKRFFNQHIAAVGKRRESATTVDKAQHRYGDLLGWHAKMDNRTSAECRAANGKNFNATKMPDIGYPGAVHPFCRCKPGKAFVTSQTVYSIQPERRTA